MKIHKVLQGSPEWLQLRATAFTASEAPAMMGCSPYMTRTELLNQKHTGMAPEVPAATQRLFDNGHATEAQFRPIAEEIIGDDLYPVTGSIELDGMTLLASFDGLTMDYSIGFEHKLFNIGVADFIDQFGEPPIYHCWQMEQQLLVSGANEILFATSDGTKENSVLCRYTSKPERRAALIAGWKQFAEDLASYVPSVVRVAPVAKVVASLPVALDMRVEGKLLSCNLEQYKPAALAYIAAINTELETEQDFGDAEADAKFCRDSANKLKLAIELALGQMGDINTALNTVKEIASAFDAKGLMLEKLVKARKDELRQQIIVKADQSLGKHEASLEQRVGHGVRIGVHADFAGVIKGKRNLDSIQDAVDTELARAKIAASELADRAEANIKTLGGEAHDWSFLFPDLATVATKPAEDFANLMAARIKAHQDAEAARKAREAEAAAKAAQVMEKAAAAAAPQAQAAINDALITGTGVVRMSTESVERIDPETVRDTGTTIKLGDINARLAPIQLTAAGLEQIGFKPVATEKGAKLYPAHVFPDICREIIKHIQHVAAKA